MSKPLAPYTQIDEPKDNHGCMGHNLGPVCPVKRAVVLFGSALSEAGNHHWFFQDEKGNVFSLSYMRKSGVFATGTPYAHPLPEVYAFENWICAELHKATG